MYGHVNISNLSMLARGMFLKTELVNLWAVEVLNIFTLKFLNTYIQQIEIRPRKFLAIMHCLDVLAGQLANKPNH